MPGADAYRHLAARPAELVRLGRAARALRRAESPADRARARAAMAAMMADARGLPMKIGQFLGTLPGDGEFEGLLHGIQPLPWARMKAALEAGLSDAALEQFTQIDACGRAASLGQVHRAMLRDGTEAAVKIQYPAISGAVALEMTLAGLLPGAGPVRRWGFDLSGYKAALKNNMRRELDYRGEADRQRTFRSQQRDPGVVVPEVLDHLCSETVLTQRWESGMPLGAARDWSKTDRQTLANSLVRLFLDSIFRTGLIHADPHAGNWHCRKARNGAPELVLYDFGCMLQMTDAQREGMVQLALAAESGDRWAARAAFLSAGFDATKLEPLEEKLTGVLELLCEPITTRGTFDIEGWRLGPRIDVLLGDAKWWFRASGPPELLLLMRAAHGVLAHLRMLGVSADWHAAWCSVRPDSPKRWPLPGQPVAAPARARGEAQYLRVRVMERGVQKVAVAVPARQVARLSELMPPEVLSATRARGIDADAIGRRAEVSGFVPQELFTLELPDKTYRVWLE
jgi:predicted unusual protein kinase regulating ubiquinone biosynthesis (AarF/ABC1/UbiB family)